MPHLNLDLDYFEHRKTLRLIGLLGKGAEVLPLKLWRYCGKYHAEDGRLAGYTVEEIETAAGWWGEPGKAVSALVTVVFLEKMKDGYVVHDWIENQGHIAAYKRKGRDMALARWGYADSNAASIAGDGDDEKAQQCHNQLNQPTNGKKKRPPSSDEDLKTTDVPGFDRWWVAWPRHTRKQGRADCVRIWKRMRLEPLADDVIRALEVAKRSRDWTKNGGEFIPFPKTWLNRTPWESVEGEDVPDESRAAVLEKTRLIHIP